LGLIMASVSPPKPWERAGAAAGESLSLSSLVSLLPNEW
jgi:hypothetical protein